MIHNEAQVRALYAGKGAMPRDLTIGQWAVWLATTRDNLAPEVSFLDAAHMTRVYCGEVREVVLVARDGTFAAIHPLLPASDWPSAIENWATDPRFKPQQLVQEEPNAIDDHNTVLLIRRAYRRFYFEPEP